MIVAILSALCVLTIAGLAVRANRRLRHHDRLPMQWSLGGEVNWTAPRAVALSLIPVLAAGMMGFVTVMTLTVGPRPGQENQVLPVTVLIGAMLVAGQWLHLWLIGKTWGKTDD